MEKRYSVGRNHYPELGPPYAVNDDKERETIAGCWKPEKAQLIVDVLNSLPRPELPEL